LIPRPLAFFGRDSFKTTLLEGVAMPILRFLCFLFLGAVALATQPVSVQAQLATSLSVIFLLAFLWRFSRGAESRQLCIALAVLPVGCRCTRPSTSVSPFSSPRSSPLRRDG